MLKQSLIVLLSLTASASLARAQCEPTWESVGAQMGNNVWTMIVFDDGSGPALFAGGNFREAGGRTASRIARWDGTVWSEVGGGIAGGQGTSVYALTLFDDGTGEALYAGGQFTMAGGLPASGIAKWDGRSWSSLGEGLGRTSDPRAYDLVVFDDGRGPALYVSGLFDTAGTMAARNIARWDGNAWSEVGGGVSSHLAAMEVIDDGSGALLVTGGNFGTAGGVSAPWMATWDGQAWAPPTGGTLNGHPGIGAMTIIDDGSGPALYVGGYFSTAGGANASRVARWDGTVWSGVGDGLDDKVQAVIEFDDGSGPSLYVGGDFSKKYGSNVDHVARLQGDAWVTVGGGMDRRVFCFTVFDDGSGPALYAGGDFSLASGFTARGVARLKCAPPRCHADCDQSTGAGVLDIFDFLCFQNGFVQFNPYACDCDTSTGKGVCDMFDFLCFQDAFVSGCP